MKRIHPAGLSQWIIEGLLGDRVSPRSLEGRSRLGEFEGLFSVVLSILLSVTKGLLAWLTSSIALLADALNNLADVGSGLIVAAGFRLARKPRDREHPYGHGRAEAVATLVLAIILAVVAFEVAHAGISRLLNPVPLNPPVWVLAVVVVTLFVKGAMALFARILARATQSMTLEAEAWNHTFDLASTSLVLTALFSTRYGWPMVDGWASLGVSVLIGYTSYRYIVEAIHSLIGEAPTHEEIHNIQRIAGSVAGVYGVHDIIIHRYGDHRLISLHAEVDALQSALEAHALAERIESTVSEAASAKVIVHVDPVDHSHPLYGPVSRKLRAVVVSESEVVGFHDLRLEGNDLAFELSVDLVVCSEIAKSDFSEILDRLAAKIRTRIPSAGTLRLGIETEYASDQEFRKEYQAGTRGHS